MRVEGDASFGDGATAVARVTDPLLEGREVALDRVGDDTFVGEITVDDVGVYAIGTSVTAADGTTSLGTALTNLSYSPEYRPGAPDGALLARIADAAGGRVQIDPAAAFDRSDLASGRSRVELAPWLYTLAAIAFVLAVVLSRLSLTPHVAGARPTRRSAAVRSALSRARPHRNRPRPDSASPATAAHDAGDAALLDELARTGRADETAAESATMTALLERRRAARNRDDPSASSPGSRSRD